ncbi:MAG: SufD family Fe-S cluster assembly protein, partial [Treponema sp.]|nr:SufD family Fe-S cluster assembly protein [Treponema sp.]
LTQQRTKNFPYTNHFLNGAAGAKGDEQENVLLMSPAAVNKSLPVILCDEEDVDGRHGSSIGRIGADILFYMQSRGIDELSAKKIMVKSKVAAASRFIQDSDVVDRINRHLEGAFA